MDNFIIIKTKLDRFNLDIKLKIVKGINCLFGPSGSGKTTIINCIAGIIKPQKAFIEIDKIKLNSTKENIFLPIHKRNIGYVFQDSRLFPHLSVEKNLVYGMRFHKEKKIKFKDVIKLLDLKNLLYRHVHNLSGGEKQRVAIGRALLCQPKLLLMDEPLASIDQNKKNQLIHYISKLDEQLKIPIIYVSHSITETFSLGKKINFIENGVIAFTGNRDQSIAFYNKGQNRFVDASYLKGKVLEVKKNTGLTEIKIGKNALTIFSDSFKVGSEVIVKINSSDIIISKKLPTGLSSLNFLKVKLYSFKIIDNLVILMLKYESNILKAHLTIQSFKKLNLKSSSYCYALIKAVNINDVINISLI